MKSLSVLLIGTAGAFLAIYAFAIYNEVPKRFLIRAALVGALGGFVYLVSGLLGCGEVKGAFYSALAVTFLSHIFARVFKKPVTLFLIPGILPTVPGAGMYRIVYFCLQNDQEKTYIYLLQTLETAGAIALAIFIVDSLFRMMQNGDWKQASLRYEVKDEESEDVEESE